MLHLLVPVRMAVRDLDETESPHVRENPWRHTKRNDVSERIEFPAKFAAGAGHPSNQSVEAVEQNRETDGDGRVIKVDVIAVDTEDRLRDGEISRGDVAGREK